MIRKPKATAIATLGVDIGKNTFHLVGLDKGWCHRAARLAQDHRATARRSGMHRIGQVEDCGTEALSCTLYTALRYRPRGDYPLVERVGCLGASSRRSS
ncbi:MAG: hypothetical protein EHM67_12785 [Hyphomicrobiaceae bacterium]|nr:MAG: hypothetical protein EHM67_12785 [Hyphomicrobiaceae bacterium]